MARLRSTHRERRWDRPIHAGDIVPAVVMEVAASAARTRTPPAAESGQPLPPGTARLRVGNYEGILERAGFRWTGRASAADLVKVGRPDRRRGHRRRRRRRCRLVVTLEQTPARRRRAARHRQPHRPDPRHGRRLRLRPQQVQPRRPGPAPGRLHVQADRVRRRHRSRLHAVVAHPRRAGRRTTPARASRRTRRRTTTASTRARSRCGACSSSRATCPTVKLMEQLTPAQVVGYARRLGFESPLQPYLSTALGASEATLLEVTSAYSAFPNQGVRMLPYSIVKVRRARRHAARGASAAAARGHPRRHGLRDGEPAARRRAARHGRQGGRHSTGRSPARPGTVDDYTDAWFVGLRSEHHRRRVGGATTRRSRSGRNETGAVGRAAHLDGVHEGLHRALRRSREPARLRSARATSSSCRSTGRPARPSTPISARRASTRPSSRARSRGSGSRGSSRRPG